MFRGRVERGEESRLYQGGSRSGILRDGETCATVKDQLQMGIGRFASYQFAVRKGGQDGIDEVVGVGPTESL